MASTSTRTRTKWKKLEETKQKQKRSITRPCEYASSSSSQEQGIGNINVEEDSNEDVCSSGCATPKAKRFRIPEVLTCPPAPKKRRVMPNCSSNRSPIAFFASPDIELFFFSALRKVPREYEVQFTSVESKMFSG
ncbi:Cyclin-dependent protein kinase inhibitor SMR13, partial [Mucuna pruriens]